jgi:hypothetical protein
MPEIGTSGLMSGDRRRGGLSVSTRAYPRLYWKSSGVQVPVPSIACIQTVSISGACGGNEARSART